MLMMFFFSRYVRTKNIIYFKNSILTIFEVFHHIICYLHINFCLLELDVF